MSARATGREQLASATRAGGGVAVALIYLGLIPGFLPALILCALIASLMLVPALLMAALAALVCLPPYAIWRATRRRPPARTDANEMSCPPLQRRLVAPTRPTSASDLGRSPIVDARTADHMAAQLAEIRRLPETDRHLPRTRRAS